MRNVSYKTTNLTKNRVTTSYAKAKAWEEHGAKIKVVLTDVETKHPRKEYR